MYNSGATQKCPKLLLSSLRLNRPGHTLQREGGRIVLLLLPEIRQISTTSTSTSLGGGRPPSPPTRRWPKLAFKRWPKLSTSRRQRLCRNRRQDQFRATFRSWRQWTMEYRNWTTFRRSTSPRAKWKVSCFLLIVHLKPD